MHNVQPSFRHWLRFAILRGPAPYSLPPEEFPPILPASVRPCECPALNRGGTSQGRTLSFPPFRRSPLPRNPQGSARITSIMSIPPRHGGGDRNKPRRYGHNPSSLCDVEKAPPECKDAPTHTRTRVKPSIAIRGC